MTYERTAQERAAPWVVTGAGIQLAGAALGAYCWYSNNSDGLNRHSALGAWCGAIIAVIGFWIMAVGIVAIGVGVALGSRLQAMPFPTPAERAAAQPSGNTSSWLDPASLAADPDPFSPHLDDPASVAQVRRACEMKATVTAVRRLINDIARRGDFTDDERRVAEALLTLRAASP